jgi:hypothetical protein
MSMVELSRGALFTISNGGRVAAPILQVSHKIQDGGSWGLLEGNCIQVLDVKRLHESHQDRFRLTLSDGMYCNNFVTLGAQLNHLVHKGSVLKHLK